MIKTAQHIIVVATFFALAACKIPVGSDDSEEAVAQASVEVDDPSVPEPQPAVPAEPATPPMPLPPPDDQDAVKFFSQASFGGSEADIASLQTTGIESWILDQINQPMYSVVDRIQEHRTEDVANVNSFSRLFWDRALNADDQLRQRVSFALSQIVVASVSSTAVRTKTVAYAAYLDLLQQHALGNYCTLVKDVSINPTMGLYLTHLGNRKADETAGFVPDENYAREVMQLFTIGLENLNSDGTGQGTETYTIEDVQGLAAIFTGLSWSDTNFFFPSVNDDNAFLPMEGFTVQHEEDPKSFLGTTVDLGTDAVTSVDAALDHLLAHPNVAPFISKQLIQKLVTSNPTPGYVSRVAAAFEAGIYEMPGGDQVGSGTRCDMAATVTAILLDDEARGVATDDNFGKLRNPVLRLAQYLRAFRVDKDASVAGKLPSAFILERLEDSNMFGINAYKSPSVFNDFRPGYVAPGTESADAGLVAPEFQIATSNSVVVYINTMENFIDGVPMDTSNDNVASVDFTTFDGDADDPAAFVDRLSRVLTGGTLSEANRTAIIDAISLIEIAGSDQDNDRKDRREVALMMLVTSPEYMVQR